MYTNNIYNYFPFCWNKKSEEDADTTDIKIRILNNSVHLAMYMNIKIICGYIIIYNLVFVTYVATYFIIVYELLCFQ